MKYLLKIQRGGYMGITLCQIWIFQNQKISTRVLLST